MKKFAIAMIAAMSLSVFAFAEDHTTTTTTDAPAADHSGSTEVKHEETTKMKGHDGKMHKMHKKTKKTTEEKHAE